VGFRRYLAIAILLSMLVGALYGAAHETFDWTRLVEVSGFHWLLVIVLAFVNVFSQGLIFKVSVERFSLKLPLRAWFGSLNITLFSNYVVPFSGFGFRAYYLNRDFGLSYRNFGLSLLAILLVEQMVFAVAGIIGASAATAGSSARVGVQWLFGAVIAGGTLAFIPLVVLLFSRFVLFDSVRRFLNDWTDYIQFSGAILRLFVITLIAAAAFISMFYVSILAITGQSNLSAALLMATIANIGLLFRIAPAGLGTFEGGIVGAGLFYGIDATSCVLVALMVRIGFMAWFFTLGPYYSWALMGSLMPKKVMS